jgi:hypothetical protein
MVAIIAAVATVPVAVSVTLRIAKPLNLLWSPPEIMIMKIIVLYICVFVNAFYEILDFDPLV